MKRLTVSLSLVVIAFLAMGRPAYAHLGWMVHEGQHPGASYSFDPTTLLVMLGAVSFTVLAFALDGLAWPRRFQAAVEKIYRSLPSGIEWRVISSLAGVLLIANALRGVFLADNIALPGGTLAMLGNAVQMGIGLLLVTQLSYAIAGLAILTVAVPLAVIAVPVGLLVDYAFEFAALGVALVLLGATSPRLDPIGYRIAGRYCKRFGHLPLPVIRVGVGLTLAVLAIHEKLMDPSMALTFLDNHNFNFMPSLGFSGFTDLHFAFAAGVAELTLGLLLVMGVATRFVTAVLSVFFTITMVAFGPGELMGHLPLFGVAFLLLIHGSGAYRMTLPRKSRLEGLTRPFPQPVSEV